jgi:hypothetical protein
MSSNAYKLGEVVQVHSLQSPSGKQMNEKRAIVVIDTPNPEGRLALLLEGENDDNIKAIKLANVRPVSRRALPSRHDFRRGVALEPIDDDASAKRACESMCDLLVDSSEKKGYEPPETNLMGLGGMLFMGLGQHNFQYFTCFDVSRSRLVLLFGLVCFSKE